MSACVRSANLTDEYFFTEGCHILEMLNVPESRELSIARARVEPGRTTRWHHLNESSERYTIVSGQGVVQLGANGEIEQAVGPWDVVEIPARCPQRITNTGEQDLVFLAICTPAFKESDYVDLGCERQPTGAG